MPNTNRHSYAGDDPHWDNTVFGKQSKFYGDFSVPLKNRATKRHTIGEAHEMVKDVSAYIKYTVLSVQ